MVGVYMCMHVCTYVRPYIRMYVRTYAHICVCYVTICYTCMYIFVLCMSKKPVNNGLLYLGEKKR